MPAGGVELVLHQALAAKGTVGFVLLGAAAGLGGLSGVTLANDLAVVVGDDVPKIGHRPVADLDGLAIQHLVARVCRREALVQDGQELLADVGGDRPAEWRIEPGYFPSPPPPPPGRLLLPGLVLELLLVACLGQLLLVQVFGVVELLETIYIDYRL